MSRQQEADSEEAQSEREAETVDVESDSDEHVHPSDVGENGSERICANGRDCGTYH